jgi:hypothetical protein
MRQADRPKRWQLDVLLAAMIGLAFLLGRAHLSAPWEIAAEVGWCALTLAGMTAWVCANRAALAQEERAARRTQPSPDGRTVGCYLLSTTLDERRRTQASSAYSNDLSS